MAGELFQVCSLCGSRGKFINAFVAAMSSCRGVGHCGRGHCSSFSEIGPRVDMGAVSDI